LAQVARQSSEGSETALRLSFFFLSIFLSEMALTCQPWKGNKKTHFSLSIMVLAMLVMASCRVGGIFVEPHTRDMDGTSFLKTAATDAQTIAIEERDEIQIQIARMLARMQQIAELKEQIKEQIALQKSIHKEKQLEELAREEIQLQQAIKDLEKQKKAEKEEIKEEIALQKSWPKQGGVGPFLPIGAQKAQIEKDEAEIKEDKKKEKEIDAEEKQIALDRLKKEDSK